MLLGKMQSIGLANRNEAYDPVEKFTVDQLDRFIRCSLQQREFMKLEFSKNLSAALSLMVEFGEYHGLSREDLAFVEIEDFLQGDDIGVHLLQKLARQSAIHRVQTPVFGNVGIPSAMESILAVNTSEPEILNI